MMAPLPLFIAEQAYRGQGHKLRASARALARVGSNSERSPATIGPGTPNPRCCHSTHILNDSCADDPSRFNSQRHSSIVRRLRPPIRLRQRFSRLWQSTHVTESGRSSGACVDRRRAIRAHVASRTDKSCGFSKRVGGERSSLSRRTARKPAGGSEVRGPAPGHAE
jgi:hypothetical protein